MRLMQNVIAGSISPACISMIRSSSTQSWHSMWKASSPSSYLLRKIVSNSHWQVGARTVDSLEHVVSLSTLRLDAIEVEALTDMSIPTDAVWLRSLIGDLSYCREVRQNSSKCLEPATDLLKDRSSFECMPDMKVTVRGLLRGLSKPSALHSPHRNRRRTVGVHCSSIVTLAGTVLMSRSNGSSKATRFDLLRSPSGSLCRTRVIDEYLPFGK